MAEETLIESEKGIERGNIILYCIRYYPDYRSLYEAILPPFFVFFFESKVEKGLFCQMIFLQSQWMNY